MNQNHVYDVKFSLPTYTNSETIPAWFVSTVDSAQLSKDFPLSIATLVTPFTAQTYKKTLNRYR